VFRFGFNNQEKDNEIYGADDATSAEFWEYDSRLGRRWNIDPVVKHDQSSYECFNNNPILYADPSGQDGEGPNGECLGDVKTQNGQTEKYTNNGWEKADQAKNYTAPEKVINEIKAKEGLGANVTYDKNNKIDKIYPYLDPKGIPTVGYGHKLKKLDDPEFANGISVEEADKLLRNDLSSVYKQRVVDNVTVPLTQNEFNVLISSVYNGGAGTSVWKVVNTNNYDVSDVFTAFLTRRTSENEELPGLISRRADEAWGYLYGSIPNHSDTKVSVEYCTKKGTSFKTQTVHTFHKWIDTWNRFADKKCPEPNAKQFPLFNDI
jgi:GH24 family phage-related lysozyme (muramidase)